MKIYFDGSSSPHKKNGSKSCISCDCGFSEVKRNAPDTTNNEAELLALSYAIEHLNETHFYERESVQIFGDSKIAINGFKKQYFKAPNLFMILMENFTGADWINYKDRIKWVSRERNRAGFVFEIENATK